MALQWSHASGMKSQTFRCGFCEFEVASALGYHTGAKYPDGEQGRIYLCPHCEQPSFFRGVFRSPSAAPGRNVEHVPAPVHDLYREARQCVGVSAFTSSVLASRKLLMNIAVSQGAQEGLSFLAYIDYLSSKGYVPPNGRGWVDHIRKRGNEAAHEIDSKTEADAVELISFTEMLLKFVYEFPAKVPAASPTP